MYDNILNSKNETSLCGRRIFEKNIKVKMDKKDKDLNANTQQSTESYDKSLEPTKDAEKIIIDPNEKEEKKEILNEKKSFRLSEENKKKSDALEAEVKAKNGNEFYGKLLDSFSQIKNLSHLFYEQDYRTELLGNLTRIVEIYDEVLRSNEAKEMNKMSRFQDKINSLNKSLEVIESENKELKNKYDKEISELKDKHIVEISELKLSLNNTKEELSKKETELKEVKSDLKDVSAKLKSSEEKLANAVSDQTKNLASIKDKDKVITELSEENRSLNAQLLERIQEVSRLERVNSELETKLQVITEKHETSLEFNKQQLALYQEQINTYKDLLNKK